MSLCTSKFENNQPRRILSYVPWSVGPQLLQKNQQQGCYSWCLQEVDSKGAQIVERIGSFKSHHGQLVEVTPVALVAGLTLYSIYSKELLSTPKRGKRHRPHMFLRCLSMAPSRSPIVIWLISLLILCHSFGYGTEHSCFAVSNHLHRHILAHSSSWHSNSG